MTAIAEAISPIYGHINTINKQVKELADFQQKIEKWKEWFFQTYITNQELIHKELKSLSDQNNELQKKFNELNQKNTAAISNNSLSHCFCKFLVFCLRPAC